MSFFSHLYDPHTIFLTPSGSNRLELLRKWVLEANAANIPVSGDYWLKNEAVSSKVRLEPPFARSNLDRFLQKTL